MMRLCVRWVVPSFGLLALSACATYWPTLDGGTHASAEEAYRCAKSQAQELGFKPFTWNDASMSVDARRPNQKATEQLPREQRQTDALQIRVRRKNGDSGGSMSVRAETTIERFTREGWVSDQVPASAEALDAAKTLIQRCS